MKRITTLLAIMLSAATLFAQAPQKFSYQAVVRNAEGEIVSNQQIGIKISIIKSTTAGPSVYVETQTPTTNENGLVSFHIGDGTVVSGSVSSINWSNDSYFVKSQIDLNGGENYTITGSSQLLSVPYALYANTVSISFVENIVNAAISDLVDAIAQLENRVDELETLIDSLMAEPPTTFVDERDGNVYQFVTIGTQVWMAENLKYLPEVSSNSTLSTTNPHMYVYGYSGTDVEEAKATENYQDFGVLYNFEAAQTACPTGWHLPSDAEWTELTDFAGGASTASPKLKAISPLWDSSMTTVIPPTDEFGFAALPGGIVVGANGNFYNMGNTGDWWTSTPSWNREIFRSSNAVDRANMGKNFAFSVRCVKD